MPHVSLLCCCGLCDVLAWQYPASPAPACWLLCSRCVHTAIPVVQAFMMLYWPSMALLKPSPTCFLSFLAPLLWFSSILSSLSRLLLLGQLNNLVPTSPIPFISTCMLLLRRFVGTLACTRPSAHVYMFVFCKQTALMFGDSMPFQPASSH